LSDLLFCLRFFHRYFPARPDADVSYFSSYLPSSLRPRVLASGRSKFLQSRNWPSARPSWRVMTAPRAESGPRIGFPEQFVAIGRRSFPQAGVAATGPESLLSLEIAPGTRPHINRQAAGETSCHRFSSDDPACRNAPPDHSCAARRSGHGQHASRALAQRFPPRNCGLRLRSWRARPQIPHVYGSDRCNHWGAGVLPAGLLASTCIRRLVDNHCAFRARPDCRLSLRLGLGRKLWPRLPPDRKRTLCRPARALTASTPAE